MSETNKMTPGKECLHHHAARLLLRAAPQEICDFRTGDPDDVRNVLCWDESQCALIVGYWNRFKGVWRDYRGCEELGHVTHWRELPSPPTFPLPSAAPLA